MCGICGFMNLTGEPPSPDILRRMNATIVHRGPDDSGEYFHRGVALGHRRLSIVDPARGHQPMSLPGSPFQIVYNGEIYNHRKIRDDLRVPPDTFRTTCDTETLLAAYRTWGPDSLHRLRGMFAFAIYDAERESLFLARDRLGIKPLYIYESARIFAFASEIKALLAHPEIRAEINHAAIPLQLSLKYMLDDQTLFKGIKKVPPGHWLQITRGPATMRKYWDIPFNPKQQYVSIHEAAAEFREKFLESVNMRLMADVPLGVFLSGGIDSSVIAAAMAKMVNDPIQTFSVAFAESGYSELEYSRKVAGHIGARIHEILVTPEEWLQAWPRMVYHEDEPIAHPASIPLHFVSRLASKSVKVVLTGEGADELLAGYDRYYQTLTNLRFGRMIPASVRSVARRLIDFLPDRWYPKRKGVRTSLYLRNDLGSLFLDNYAAFARGALEQVLQPRYVPEAIDGIYEGFYSLMDASDATELLDRILYADLKTYLQELLMKQDQMSMSVSIESRVPFLDHLLVEFVCRLPVEFKLRGFETKRILRVALGHTLPQEIVTRPKRGFPTPIREWFRTRLHSSMRQLLLDPNAMIHDFVKPEYVLSTLDRHRRGQWNLEEQIWTLGNLELWLQIFIARRDADSIFAGAVPASACQPAG